MKISLINSLINQRVSDCPKTVKGIKIFQIRINVKTMRKRMKILPNKDENELKKNDNLEIIFSQPQEIIPWPQYQKMMEVRK